jgi:hypothetical protein
VKIDSVLETARNDRAVVPASAARERVWSNLSRPRRSRSTVLVFATSAAFGALLCFGLVRLLQPPAAVQHLVVEAGTASVLTLKAPARVDVGKRHIELEEGTATLRVAADGSGVLEVAAGTCFLTDSEGRHRVSGTEKFDPQLSAEVAMYQRGWAQLTTDPKAALDVFDTLLGRFPHGALEQEARLSRIEALQALGRRPDAAREARAFLNDFPQSERAGELKKLLEEK